MEREIKFRGLRTDGKGWVYGYYFYDNQAIQSYIIDDETNVDVFSESVGQFTGLHDKNGTEIYEGDFVMFYTMRYRDGVSCKVEWDNRGMWIPFRDDDYIQDEFGYWFIFDLGFEIKGNIHQK